MTAQKLEGFTVDRAVAILNTAKQHGVYPHAIPEDDQKKIEEAEKLATMADQAIKIAESSGKDKVRKYDALRAVLVQAEVLGGANGDFVPGQPQDDPDSTDVEILVEDGPGDHDARIINAIINGKQTAWPIAEALAEMRRGCTYQVIDGPSLQALRDELPAPDLPNQGTFAARIPEDQQVAVTVDGINDVWSWDQLVEWVVTKGNTNVVVNDDDRREALELLHAEKEAAEIAKRAVEARDAAPTAPPQSRVPDMSATNPVGTPQKGEHWVDTAGNVYLISIAGGTAGEVKRLLAGGEFDQPFVLPWDMFTRPATPEEIGAQQPSTSQQESQPSSAASPSPSAATSAPSESPVETPVAASTTPTPETPPTSPPAPASSPVASSPPVSGSSSPEGTGSSTASQAFASPEQPPAPPASPSPPTATPVPAPSPSVTPPPTPEVLTSPPSQPSQEASSPPLGQFGSSAQFVRSDPALDNDEGNEQYGTIIDKAYSKLQQRAGTPLPGEPLEPPEMPVDPSSVDALTNRRLHLAFNACAAWVHRLIGIHNQVSIDCGRYRDGIYRAHREEARGEIGKQATITEQNDWIVIKNFDDIESWIRRQEYHADQERALRVLYSIYTENVSVLSRDYSMQSKDEAGSR